MKKIVALGGGDTLKMMKIWRKNDVEKILKEAWEKSIVLCGLSAGSICWFKWGNSDSRRFTNPKTGLIKVSGLGLINALHCPHYNFEKNRKPNLKKILLPPGIQVQLVAC